jgi:hypothetical protein
MSQLRQVEQRAASLSWCHTTPRHGLAGAPRHAGVDGLAQRLGEDHLGEVVHPPCDLVPLVLADVRQRFIGDASHQEDLRLCQLVVDPTLELGPKYPKYAGAPSPEANPSSVVNRSAVSSVMTITLLPLLAFGADQMNGAGVGESVMPRYLSVAHIGHVTGPRPPGHSRVSATGLVGGGAADRQGTGGLR